MSPGLRGEQHLVRVRVRVRARVRVRKKVRVEVRARVRVRARARARAGAGARARVGAMRASLRELRRVVRAFDGAEVGAAVVQHPLRLFTEGDVRCLVAEAAEAGQG